MAETLRLVIKTINNETYDLEVANDIPVTELKEKVRLSTSISEDRQRLIFRGQVLVDESCISAYKIEDGQTIHMVARPENFRELRAMAESEASRQRHQSPLPHLPARQGSDLASTLSAASFITLAGGDVGSLGGGLFHAQQREARSETGQTSLEHVRQDILTMHTLLSTMSIDQETQVVQGDEKYADTAAHADAAGAGFAAEKETSGLGNEESFLSANALDGVSSPSKRFFVGQWMDVKDTVNQWLEATVMGVNPEQATVYMHYNGWPARWDEWIPIDSPRIAPFRTRTVHSSSSGHSSPTPNAAAAHAPITGRDDVRAIIPEITAMLYRLTPALNEISGLAESSFATEPGLYDRTEGSAQVAPHMPWRTSPQKERAEKPPQDHDSPNSSGGSSPCSRHRFEEKMPADVHDEAEDGRYRDDVRLKFLAGELSPLLDRLGRALTDMAPHLRSFSDIPIAPGRPGEDEESKEADLPSEQTPLRDPFSGLFDPVSGRSTRVGGGAPAGATPTAEPQRQTGFDALEALTSMLRSRRAPSPPPEMAYRQNISTSSSRGALGDAGTGSSGHVDIHIHAILSPLSRLAGLAAGLQAAPRAAGVSAAVAAMLADPSSASRATAPATPLNAAAGPQGIAREEHSSGRQTGGSSLSGNPFIPERRTGGAMQSEMASWMGASSGAFGGSDSPTSTSPLLGPGYRGYSSSAHDETNRPEGSGGSRQEDHEAGSGEFPWDDANTSPAISLRKQIPAVRSQLGVVHTSDSSAPPAETSHRILPRSGGECDSGCGAEGLMIEDFEEEYESGKSVVVKSEGIEDSEEVDPPSRRESEERMRSEEQLMMNAEAPHTPPASHCRRVDMVNSDPGVSRGDRKSASPSRSLSPVSRDAKRYSFPSVLKCSDAANPESANVESSNQQSPRSSSPGRLFNRAQNVLAMASGQQREIPQVSPSTSRNRLATGTPNTPAMTVVKPNGDVSLLQAGGTEVVEEEQDNMARAEAAESPPEGAAVVPQPQTSRSIMERIRRSIFDFGQSSTPAK